MPETSNTQRPTPVGVQRMVVPSDRTCGRCQDGIEECVCDNVLDEDDRPADDFCRANGWDGLRDCPNPNCDGGLVDFLPCPDCDGDGIVEE